MEEEKMIKNSPEPVNISGTKEILNQMMKCICKIKINNTYGTGFFCKIPFQSKTINFLMTNYHIINENYYENNNELNLFLNDEKEVKIINLRQNRITYFNKDYDITIIELKENDNINDYMELDNNLFKNEINAYYKDISIYIIQYPLGKQASVSYGLLNEINEYDIKHSCSTERGSSGSPILNLLTNKIIGIHKMSLKSDNYNIGTSLKFPLIDFFNKFNLNYIINDNNNLSNVQNVNNNNYDNNFNIINNTEFYKILNDILNDIKILNLIPGPSKNIVFRDGESNQVLHFPYGMTIDKCLKMFLRTKLYISDIEGYYSNINCKLCYNGKYLELGDETHVEQYFGPGLSTVSYSKHNNCINKYQFNQEEMRQLLKETKKLESTIQFFRNMEELILIERQKLLSTLDPETELPSELILKDTETKDITVNFKRKNKENIIITMSNSCPFMDLINEYFSKTEYHKCIFKFRGNEIFPHGIISLKNYGLKNNSIINVIED